MCPTDVYVICKDISHTYILSFRVCVSLDYKSFPHWVFKYKYKRDLDKYKRYKVYTDLDCIYSILSEKVNSRCKNVKLFTYVLNYVLYNFRQNRCNYF